MSDSTGETGETKKTKSRFLGEFLWKWLGILSGGISALYAIYQEIVEYVRQEKWGTLPYWFIAYACMIFTAWVFYREMRAERDRLRAAIAVSADRRKVREALGQLLCEGRDLMETCVRDDPAVFPAKEFEDWSARVEAVLLRELDSSYRARFRNAAAGLPQVVTSPPIEQEAHRRLWATIRSRVMRLDEFLGELAAKSN